MLHQDMKSPDTLELKHQAKLHLPQKQSIKRVLRSNILRHFNLIMGQNLKTKLQSCLKNTVFRFEEQQQNISIPTRPL